MQRVKRNVAYFRADSGADSEAEAIKANEQKSVRPSADQKGVGNTKVGEGEQLRGQGVAGQN